MFGLGLVELIIVLVIIIIPVYFIFIKKKVSVGDGNLNEENDVVKKAGKDIKNIELFKNNFNRLPTLLFLFLELIPLIFLLYWVHTRINSFNKMTKYKISIAWSLTYILFLPIGLILVVLLNESESAIQAGAEGVFAFFVVYHLYIPFRLLKVLKEFTKENEFGIHYDWIILGLLTFFLGGAHIYVNYKINEVIDYIDKNNILDKEEITSSEEASSDNNNDSPEEKLTKLAELKEKGLIDEDDYNSKKEEILKTI